MQRKTIRSHEDLEVWKLAMRTAADVYRMTAKLPGEERFGLQAQMRRSAVSIASNIAEGAARNSTADFGRFISISLSSLAELETQYLLCQDLRLLTRDEEVHRRMRAIGIMLSALRRSLLSSRDRHRG